jgi:hypothetical protein
MNGNVYLNMDNSKVESVRPKIGLHVWSDPHLNTLVAITGEILPCKDTTGL